MSARLSISIHLPPPQLTGLCGRGKGQRGTQRKGCEVLTSAHGMAVAQLSRGAIACSHQLLKMEPVGSYRKLVVLKEGHQGFGGVAAARLPTPQQLTQPCASGSTNQIYGNKNREREEGRLGGRGGGRG